VLNFHGAQVRWEPGPDRVDRDGDLGNSGIAFNEMEKTKGNSCLRLESQAKVQPEELNWRRDFAIIAFVPP
jgi:hypothetical protein